MKAYEGCPLARGSSKKLPNYRIEYQHKQYPVSLTCLLLIIAVLA